MSTETKATPRRLVYPDAEQAAAAIGVSARLLEQHRDEWGVPYKRLGGRIVYPIKALEKWVNTAERRSIGEPDQK
jgi:hypothetical protein